MYFVSSESRKVNIEPGNEDPFYRYKVRQLVCHNVGKGCKARTQFQNLDRFASGLHIPKTWILHWLKIELNTRVNGDSVAETSLERIDASLVRMIKALVLCPKCNLPELSYWLDKSKTKSKFRLRCDSCGFYGRIQKYRNAKVLTYLTKTHPGFYHMNVFV